MNVNIADEDSRMPVCMQLLCFALAVVPPVCMLLAVGPQACCAEQDKGSG